MSLPLETRVEKAVHGVEMHWLSNKKKKKKKKKQFQVQWSVKVMLTDFWDMKGPITINTKQCFLLLTPLAKLTLFIE